MKPKPRLMIPGPVDVDDDILAAMAEPTLPHYGEAWMQIYFETVDQLKLVFGTKNDLFLMVGPGSAALDAALGSLAKTGEKVMVAYNGFFGHRLGTIAGAYGLEVCAVTAPWGQPLDPEAIRQQLAAHPDVQALVVVHLETSTGVLNPVQEIAAVAHEFDVPIILDAVSSLAGVPLPVDEWGIDVCVTVANKCLACPPGLAPISVSRRAWEQMDRKSGRAHGWYLDLRVWKDYAVNWASWHPYPTTLATNNIVALRASLRRILDGGLEAHYARFCHAAETVRAGLKEMGFEMYTAEAHTSPVISAVRGLPGMDIPAYQRYLLAEYQTMIAGGLEELHGKIFRVGHIGRAVSDEYVQQFLAGTKSYLQLTGG